MTIDAETKYRLLEEISQKIRDTLNLDDILNHLLEMVHSIMEFDAAGIFVLNEEVLQPHRKQSGALIAGIAMRGFDLRPPNIDPMLSAGKGIVGYVIKSGESVVSPDVRNDSRYIIGRKGTLSEVAVPIVKNGRVVGALNLESDKPAAYGEANLEVLRFFADAAAISIQKAVLHQQILAEKRIEEQLKVAHEVQSRLLPDKPPRVPGYDIAGTSISTYEIGGDYYDYLRLPDGKTGIVVADVSGQGVPAALIMTAFRALLRSQARLRYEPEHIVDALKRMLPEFIGENHFVTSIYGVLDPAKGHFAYVNCGHIAPLLFHAGGGVEQLKTGGPVLSPGLGDSPYRADEIELAPGDLLLLYTDGVVEIEAENGEDFGEERLRAIMQRSLHLPGSEIVRALIRATREFSGSDEYQDDFTLVIVRRT